MASVGAILVHTAKRVRVVDPRDWQDGRDLADAIADGWDKAQIIEWARERVVVLSLQPEPLHNVSRGTPRHAPGELPEHVNRSVHVVWQELQLSKSDRGPYPNEANALLILRTHPAFTGRIWLNAFSRKLMMDDHLFGKEDAIAALCWIQQELDIPKFTLSSVERAAQIIGITNQRNPVLEYLNGLQWDGRARIETTLTDAWGATENQYIRAVSQRWLVSLVARIMEPGCQADYMPVFEGGQGVFKSSSLRALIGNNDWFLESQIDPLREPQNFLLSLQGKWLVEIPEMHSIAGRADGMDKVKSIITIRTDTYRVPYGASTMDYPRQCIFAGTTNRDTWNTDYTGGRRFWPVTCGTINLDYLCEHRDQIFAEAMHVYQRSPGSSHPSVRVKAQSDWWQVPLEDARREQESRRVVDEWEELIERFVHSYPDRSEFKTVWMQRNKSIESATIGDILEVCLGVPPGRWTQGDQNRVARAFIALGWQKRRFRDGERRYVGYQRALKPCEMTEIRTENEV